MKRLANYLIENLIENKKSLPTREEALQWFKQYDVYNQLQDKLGQTLTEFDIDNLYNYQQQNNMSCPIVANYGDKPGQFSFRRWVADADVLLDFDFEKHRKPYMGLHDTAMKEDGTVGVKTPEQENATCDVFNKYCGEDLTEDEINKYIDSLDYLNGIWKKSCKIQIKTFDKLLKIFNLNKKDYRMDRYEEQEVGTAYAAMVAKYRSLLQETKKFSTRDDTFDPSDTVIYNVNKKDIIIGMLNQLSGVSGNPITDIKNVYIDKLYKEKLCFGISLKQLNKEGKITEFNGIGDNNIIRRLNNYEWVKIPFKTKKNGKLVDSKNQGIEIQCNINTRLSNPISFTSDLDSNVQSVQTLNNVLITMRTFGGDQPDIDVKIPGEPALGKCPRFYWRRLLMEVAKKYDVKYKTKLSKEDVKHDSRKIFGEMVLNEEFFKSKEMNDFLLNILQKSIKDGIYCFPFVLIH